MRHFNRFRSWVRRTYDAWFRAGLSAGESNGTEESTVGREQAQLAASDSAETDFLVAETHQSAHQQTGTVEFSTEPVEKEVVPEVQVPISRTDPASKDTVSESELPEDVAHSIEPQQAISSAKETVVTPQQPIAEQSIVANPEASAARDQPKPTSPVELKVVAKKTQQALPPAQDLSTLPQKLIAQTSSVSRPPIAQSPKKVSKSDKPQVDDKGETKKRKAQVAKHVKIEVPGMVAGKPASAENLELPASSIIVEPEKSTGSGSGSRPAGGRYSPGAVNDQTAQRLARLLISEIKLYNKPTVDRAGNNVYGALKEHIDKARKYYEQRLGTLAVKSMPDYFHAELVRALCDGDPSRLGPNYQSSDK